MHFSIIIDFFCFSGNYISLLVLFFFHNHLYLSVLQAWSYICCVSFCWCILVSICFVVCVCERVSVRVCARTRCFLRAMCLALARTSCVLSAQHPTFRERRDTFLFLRESWEKPLLPMRRRTGDPYTAGCTWKLSAGAQVEGPFWDVLHNMHLISMKCIGWNMAHVEGRIVNMLPAWGCITNMSPARGCVTNMLHAWGVANLLHSPGDVSNIVSSTTVVKSTFQRLNLEHSFCNFNQFYLVVYDLAPNIYN